MMHEGGIDDDGIFFVHIVFTVVDFFFLSPTGILLGKGSGL